MRVLSFWGLRVPGSIEIFGEMNKNGEGVKK
jgi:hypothetical protein